MFQSLISGGDVTLCSSVMEFYFFIQSFSCFTSTLYTKAVQFHISTYANTLPHTHNLKDKSGDIPSIFVVYKVHEKTETNN